MSYLLKEAFTFRKYKAMHNVLAVFTGILMIPIVIASFLATAVFAALAFTFSILASPVKYLHEIVRGEREGVKHATQFIIYLISWPTVFFLYVLMSGLLLLMLPTYALLTFLLYVWSLGGFKFHLFPNQYDDLSIEVEGRYRYLPLIFIIIGGMTTVVVPMVHGVIHFVDLYEMYMERFFGISFFGGIYPDYISIFSAFAVLYSLIGFARNPKKSVDAE